MNGIYWGGAGVVDFDSGVGYGWTYGFYGSIWDLICVGIFFGSILVTGYDSYGF